LVQRTADGNKITTFFFQLSHFKRSNHSFPSLLIFNKYKINSWFCYNFFFCFLFLLYVVSNVLGSGEIEMMETQRRDDDKDGLGIEKPNNVHLKSRNLKSRNREIKKEKQTTTTVLHGLPIQGSSR